MKMRGRDNPSSLFFHQRLIPITLYGGIDMKLARKAKIAMLSIVNNASANIADATNNIVTRMGPAVDTPEKRLEEVYNREANEYGNIPLILGTIAQRFKKPALEIRVDIGPELAPGKACLTSAGKTLFEAESFSALRKTLTEIAITEDEARMSELIYGHMKGSK
jgi:hypothetical protein